MEVRSDDTALVAAIKNKVRLVAHGNNGRQIWGATPWGWGWGCSERKQARGVGSDEMALVAAITNNARLVHLTLLVCV